MMKHLVPFMPMLFSVLFVSVALLRVCAKYLCKCCRRNSKTKEVILLPLISSSSSSSSSANPPTTTSVLHNCPSDDILPSLIPLTTSEEEKEEQRQEEEEEEEEVLLAGNNVCFQDLPSELLVHIISFLPLATIGPLLRVCKTWNDVLRDPDNMDFLLGRKPLGRPNNNPIYLLEENNFVSPLADFYILQSTKTSSYHFSELGFGKRMSMTASCSGFICCSSHKRETTIFLCNPLTQEFVKLPQLPDDSTSQGFALFGLGIDLTRKKSSKLVRMIWKSPKESPQTHCDVYTFGSNCWRSVEVPKFQPWDHGVLYNWTLYWMVCDNPSSSSSFSSSSTITPMLAFDLESEKFSLVPPPCKEKGHKLTYSYLVKLGDELGCVDEYESEMIIHVLEDDVTMVWKMRYRLIDYPWTCSTSNDRISIFGVWSNDSLLVTNSEGIYYYDPNRMKIQEICVPGCWRCCSLTKYVVGQYFPNLMSPKIFWS